MRIFVALLSVTVGLLLLVGGYRLARFFIPLLGFVAGLSIGGAIVADASNAAFLGTALGVVIGIVVGLVLAVFAYLYYYLAVVVLAGSIGYWAGSGFIEWLGFNPGLLSALVGIGLGVVSGFLAMAYNAPKYMLILLTAFAGAILSTGGVMLLFNDIPLSAYSYTAAHVAVLSSFAWTLLAIALFVVGAVVQTRLTTGYTFEEWATGDHTHLPPTTTTQQPGMRS